MKERTRRTLSSEPEHMLITSEHGVHFDGLFVDPGSVTFREVTDWIGKRAIGGRLPPTPCDDYRVFFVPSDMGPWKSSNGFYQLSFSSGAFSWDPRPFRADLVNRSPGPESAAQKAFDSFSEQVPEDISIGNFAIELRDALNLIPSLLESFAKARPYLTKAGRRMAGADGVINDASDEFLKWNFATAPLIGDLRALAGLVQSTQTRLEEIRKLNRKTTRMGYTSRALKPVIPVIVDPVYLGLPDNVFHHGPRANLVATDSTFRAKCDLKVNIPSEELDGMIGMCRTLFAKTGLNNPLGVIWNAIPFSFVLDWVFRFSDMLARRAIQPFTGEWAVQDFTWSLQQTALWAVHQPVEDAPFVNREILRGHIHVQRYQRGLDLPANELETLVKGLLTPKQAALLLCLSRPRFR